MWLIVRLYVPWKTITARHMIHFSEYVFSRTAWFHPANLAFGALDQDYRDRTGSRISEMAQSRLHSAMHSERAERYSSRLCWASCVRYDRWIVSLASHCEETTAFSDTVMLNLRLMNFHFIINHNIMTERLKIDKILKKWLLHTL